MTDFRHFSFLLHFPSEVVSFREQHPSQMFLNILIPEKHFHHINLIAHLKMLLSHIITTSSDLNKLFSCFGAVFPNL